MPPQSASVPNAAVCIEGEIAAVTAELLDRSVLLDRSIQTSVGGLLGALRVARMPNGAVQFEAPPLAAGALNELFQGMAQLLAHSLAPQSVTPLQAAGKRPRPTNSR
ncbi:MAG TPA: hypothetical protein VHM70_23155 [Polyangiaceae bacterium]|jgi:hypothetical protein|nr:hypothetical protein [Polyangiaceae bacterium]